MLKRRRRYRGIWNRGLHLNQPTQLKVGRVGISWRPLGTRIIVFGFIVLQFASVLSLLLPPSPARAASLTVVSATSETLQSTTSTSYVDTDTTIASGSLPAGTYFVAWGAAAANASANASSRVRLVRGSTEIAATSQEGSIAASTANNGSARSGYWLGTLSGSEALTIQYNSSSGAQNTRIDSKFIKAIRLDTNLIADTDYFTSGSQESGSDELANAGTASFSDVKTLTKTFGSGTENYLVFASLEYTPDSTSNDCNTRLEVDGVAAMTSTMEGENAGDQAAYAVAKVFSIGSGSKTIKLQGQSVGSATCDFLRSRIYVFRASIFDQVVESYSSGESTLASGTFTDKNSQAYTPNQSETVMVIGSRALGTNSTACSAATRIDDGTTQYVDTHSFTPNNATPDYVIGMSAASRSVSSATTFKVQYQRVNGTCTVKIKESTMIIWSMTLKPAALKQSAYRWFSASSTPSSNWCNDTSGITCTTSWTNRRKITINNSASAENLTNYPLLIKLNSSRIDYSKTQSGGQDLRFVDPSNDNLVLPHEIEEFDESGDDYVWVKVPQIDSGSTTDYIWMYYGNASASNGEDAINVWDTDYKMVQHLEETGACSVTFTDSTTNGNNGSCNGSGPIAAAAGKIDGAREFDGSSQYVGITHAASQNVTNGTFQGWINRDVTNAFHFILEKGLDDADAYSLYVDDANHVTFHYRDGGNQDHTYVDTSTTISASTWYLISATFDDTNNSFKIYINATSNFSQVDNNSLPAPTDQLRIGAESFSGIVGVMDGKIDDARISSKVRSADWIEADYLNGTDALNGFGAEEGQTSETLTALANQDTAYTLTSTGQDFRLRMLLHVSTNFLPTGEQTLKLQFATKSGTCDTAYSGESFNDVATGSGNIRYKDVSGKSDGDAYTTNGSDPTHSSDTVTGQTYEESNNFTTTSRLESGTDGKWDFSLVDFSAPASTAYCFRVVTSGGSAIGTPDVVPEITTASGSNTAPSSPSSLAQKKTNDTTLSTGDWTNETSIKLAATVTDSDGGDTIKICAEVDPIGTAFSSPSGDGDGCSTSGVSTGNTATVTISGLSTDTEYHWQIKAKDAAGAYSSWVTYGGNTENPPTNPAARDFGVDTSAPTGGTVYDGTTNGVDKAFSDTSLSALSANWASISASTSGLQKYEYSIGTTPGGTTIKDWTNNNTTTSVTATGLTLQTSVVYYVNVKTYDNAGNTSTISSNGQMVAPSLSFSIAPTTLTFSNLNLANSYTDTKTTTLTSSTNAYAGYTVRLAATDFLRAPGGGTIPNFNGGTYASPDSWQSGDTGFGYTSNDTSVQGSNKFQNTPNCPGGSAHASPGCYAPYSFSGPGDIVADHTANVSGSPITNEEFTLTHRLTVPSTQGATNYTAILLYTISALY